MVPADDNVTGSPLFYTPNKLFLTSWRTNISVSHRAKKDINLWETITSPLWRNFKGTCIAIGMAWPCWLLGQSGMVELIQEWLGWTGYPQSRVPGSFKDGKSDKRFYGLARRRKTSTIRFIPQSCEGAIWKGWENTVSPISCFLRALDRPPDGDNHGDGEDRVSAIHFP